MVGGGAGKVREHGERDKSGLAHLQVDQRHVVDAAGHFAADGNAVTLAEDHVADLTREQGERREGDSEFTTLAYDNVLRGNANQAAVQILARLDGNAVVWGGGWLWVELYGPRALTAGGNVRVLQQHVVAAVGAG